MDEEPQQIKDQDGSSSKTKPEKNNGSSVSNTPRKRVSQACDRCRSRKDKCDGKKPVCSTCAALDQVCSYDPATKKRGLPEGYVRGLEKLWGLTIREADGVEDAVLSILNGGEEGQEFEILVRIWNDQEGSETLLETWRKSRISHELERLLPSLDSVEEKPGKRKLPESGLPRVEELAEVSQPVPRLLGADNQLPVKSPCNHHDEVPQRASVHDSQRRRLVDTAPTEVQTDLADLVQLPSRAWQLLDVFFSYTHCWLPVIEKHDLLRTSYQYSPHGRIKVNTSEPGSGDHAALWAVLTYADYQHTTITSRDPQDDIRWNVESMYSYTKRLIPAEDGIFEVGHIQALIALTLLNMGMNHWDRAWLLIGQAVRIAVNIGLDQNADLNLQRFKRTEKQPRSKHVFLGCFALDTLISARLGRKPQLRKEDVEPAEEDGPAEWNEWNDCLGVRRSIPEGPHGPTAILSTFNRLIVLFKIINSVICDESSGRRRVEHCTALLKELDSWGQVLPTLLDPSSKPPLLPHRFHLHLAHVSTMAVVYSHLSTCSKQMQVSDSTIAETFATTARQTMWLLLRQSEDFGLLISPPTYDYFTRIAYKSAIKVQDSLADSHLTYKDWQRNMEKSLAGLERVWPTFEGLRKVLATELADATYQYQSSPAAGSFDIAQHIPTNAKNLSNNVNVSPITQIDFPGNAMTFPRPRFNPLFNLAASVGLHRAEGSSPTYADQNFLRDPFIDQPSIDQLQYHEDSLGSDVDADSFADLATLDAMEWTNNWDQSLLNLGFTDPVNMNSDFIAFCREPDPLYSNNLVQQLLSSTPNTRNEVSQQAREDFSLGETGSEFENPLVEASHILQALSTAPAHGLGQGPG